MKPLILILFILIVTNGYSQDYKYYEDLADLKTQEGDYKYAMVLIEKAIALNDTNQWLLLKMADIDFKLHGPLSAIEIVNRAIKINPMNSEPYNRAGTYYNSAGMIDSSIIMYDFAIERAFNDTGMFSYIQNRGNAKAARRDFEGARIDLEQALKFNPEEVGVLNNIAPVYRQLGMTDKAIECLNKVITLDSAFIGPYVNLGFIYSKLDSFDLAIKYFDRALLIDPNEPLIYNNRGYAYLMKGEYSKALKDINKSISLYPTNSYAYRNLALVYLKQNNINEACTALDFASGYGFTSRYGDEVDELIKKYCEK